MYSKEFEVRWSDIDANRHLANSAYINFMSHTRLAFLTDLGLSHNELKRYNLGPVVFYEHVYYFREILPGPPVRVTIQLSGMAEDGRFFEFHHDFYDYKGTHMAHCEMMGAWIDMKTRKITGLPPEVLQKFEEVARPMDFRVLTREDTRKYAKKPKDLV